MKKRIKNCFKVLYSLFAGGILKQTNKQSNVQLCSKRGGSYLLTRLLLFAENLDCREVADNSHLLGVAL